MSSSPRRVDIREILSDPERRRRLMVAGIQTDQRREGIDTTPGQADRAYRIVTERERAAFFKLKPLRGSPDRRHEGFVAALSDGEGVRFDVAASASMSPGGTSRLSRGSRLPTRSSVW